MAFRYATSNQPARGAASSSMSRAAVAFASKAASCWGSRMSRRFRRTSVPGYVYGSDLPDIQRSNLRGHVVGGEVTSDVAIEDSLGRLGRFKALQPHGRHSACDASLAFGSFFVRNRFGDPGHGCCPLNILPWCGAQAVVGGSRFSGLPGRDGQIRTADLSLRRRPLYPSELRPRDVHLDSTSASALSVRYPGDSASHQSEPSRLLRTSFESLTRASAHSPCFPTHARR